MKEQDFLKLLKTFNGGILRGAKRNLSKKLKCSETLITHFVKGRQKPSEKIIKEMANILSTSEDKLQKIFDIGDQNIVAIGDNNNISYNQMQKELELKEEKIKFLEEQIAFYKSKQGGKK